MRQVRQGFRSTKKKLAVAEEKDDSNTHTPVRKKHDIYVQIDRVKIPSTRTEQGSFQSRHREGINA